MGLTSLKTLDALTRKGYVRITNKYNIAELDELKRLVRAWEPIPDAKLAFVSRKPNFVVLCRPASKVRIDDEPEEMEVQND